MTSAAHPWDLAMTALGLLAVDPAGLGGVVVRARVGPVFRAFEARLKGLDLPQRRIPSDISEDQLYGGPDLTATLAEGRLVHEPGLADRPSLLIVPMAERTPPDAAARLAQFLDQGLGHSLLLYDERAPDEDGPPEVLCERLALSVDLDLVGRLEATGHPATARTIQAARDRLPSVTVDEPQIAALTTLAMRCAIDSLRAPLLALRAARANAALHSRDTVADADLEVAVALVYASRAKALPTEAPEPEDPVPPPPEDDHQGDGPSGDDSVTLPTEMLIEALAAQLPSDLLKRMGQPGSVRRAKGSGAGAKRTASRRGRPLPARPGRLTQGARVDLVATLRSAAPWQPLRRKARPGLGDRLIIHPSDIRLRRREERAERLLIFCVDASGSTAMARLGEAKGAVELLLAQAYARRDHVALVAFRGQGADLLLPPTRALVQAKRRLAALPGGGGTPLAAGLAAVADTARQAAGHGLTPALALLTDGRANVALDGTGDRPRATEDAMKLAQTLRAEGIPSLLIDTSPRPAAAASPLAQALGAAHLALPRADANRIAAEVSAHLVAP